MDTDHCNEFCRFSGYFAVNSGNNDCRISVGTTSTRYSVLSVLHHFCNAKIQAIEVRLAADKTIATSVLPPIIL